MNMKPIGMTKDGTFQAGMRRTLTTSPERLRQHVISAEGRRALGKICPLNRDADGVSTFVPGSHYRRRLDQGLLQVRVLPAAHGKATIALHMESLSDPQAREATLTFMDHTLTALSAGVHEPVTSEPGSDCTT